MAAKKKKVEESEEPFDLAMTVYPWQKEQRDFLLSLAFSSRLHHAFLFHGAANLGKFDFSCAMAASLLCEGNQQGVSDSESGEVLGAKEQTVGQACQSCHACHLVRSMTHPDFFVIRPEKEGKAIPVDAIRELIDFMSKSSGRNGRRIVIIDQCHQMNTNASNALLKFLEEPGEGVHIFLVCSELDSMLPTIRSRCQKLSFSSPDYSEALAWLEEHAEIEVENGLLEYAAGSPLLAMKLREDPIFVDRRAIISGLKYLLQTREGCMSYASQWSDYSLLLLLAWWHACLVDTLKITAGADIEHLRFQSLYADLEVFAGSVEAESLLGFIQELFTLRVQLLRGAPFTQSLMLESLLLKWQALAK